MTAGKNLTDEIIAAELPRRLLTFAGHLSACGAARRCHFIDSRRAPLPRQGLHRQGLHRQRLYRGGRCADEDWKYTGGLFIWRTPANMTAGRKSRRNWPGKVASELSDCSQAVESGWRSMSNAQGAGNQRRRPASADRLECDARESDYLVCQVA